ncbi:MAG TPA: oxygen-independent coproporphyrinogen III oxidase [Deltaproteobacteria bacterium]|nr:oxygen-independent coproporphyrinogen III oxidase [Deltaproteobacteria bacterium]
MSREALDLDFAHAEAVLARYEGPGPRYTSYPTVPVWTEAYAWERFAADLADVGESPLSLYVHVPFCRSLCHFCACNRVITRDPALPERYLEETAREIGAIRDRMPCQPTATQVHLGGGTPTHLSPGQLRHLFGALVDAFPLQRGAELSIEVDPRVTREEQVDTLRELGFQRISMGVQDFDPRVQEAIHRVQPARETAQLVELSRRLGFESVNFDLIYGLPFQDENSFARTLDTVLAIQPERIALYSYAHVTWVAKQQRGFERHHLPDARTKLRVLWLAVCRFLAAGYVYIGMDHFARPEDELARAQRERSLRRNFMGYTTQAGVEVVGFGPSAISALRTSYAQNERELDAWEAALRDHGLATRRGHSLTQEDLRRRWIIECIMCQGELRADDYAARFHGNFAADYAPELRALEPLAADGLVEMDPNGTLRATALGRLLVRNLAMRFDAYLGEQQRVGTPRFSKAV